MLSGIAGNKGGAASIAASSLMQLQPDKKAAYRPLLLDTLGRQIDDKGNVIKEVRYHIT